MAPSGAAEPRHGGRRSSQWRKQVRCITCFLKVLPRRMVLAQSVRCHCSVAPWNSRHAVLGVRSVQCMRHVVQRLTSLAALLAADADAIPDAAAWRQRGVQRSVQSEPGSPTALQNASHARRASLLAFVECIFVAASAAERWTTCHTLLSSSDARHSQKCKPGAQ